MRAKEMQGPEGAMVALFPGSRSAAVILVARTGILWYVSVARSLKVTEKL
jgi:hypothetical protein